MPVTTTFHTKLSPPKQPIYGSPKVYQRPQPDPADQLLASKANELLNMRSKNISYMMAQRQEAGNDYGMPPARAALVCPAV